MRNLATKVWELRPTLHGLIYSDRMRGSGQKASLSDGGELLPSTSLRYASSSNVGSVAPLLVMPSISLIDG